MVYIAIFVVLQCNEISMELCAGVSYSHTSIFLLTILRVLHPNSGTREPNMDTFIWGQVDSVVDLHKIDESTPK